MDIFDFALEKERFSEEYYRDLAGRTNHAGLRNILTMLADEEAKHYRTVEQMKAGTPPELAQTPILEQARDIFEKIRDTAQQFSFNLNEADLYRKACTFEEKSMRFYLEKADQVEDPAQKEIFRRLAREEEKHLFLMDNLRSFVSRPETFLENAEIYHFNDYVGGQF